MNRITLTCITLVLSLVSISSLAQTAGVSVAAGMEHRANAASGPTRTLTLEYCYQAAEQNYPLVRQYGLIEKTRDYTVANASRAYLPQVTFSAKASWQSDVTKFSIDKDKIEQAGFGGMVDADKLNGLLPKMSKDQYGASIDISQTIWDGGAVKAQKEVAESQSEADAKNIESSIYGLRQKINELYFGIILMQTSIDLDSLMLGTLGSSLEQAESYMANGIIGQADVDAIRIQILRTKQEALNLRNTKDAYMTMLGLLTGLHLDKDAQLSKPQPITRNATITRPELRMFEAQMRQIESQNRQINAGLTPKFGLYVNGGYGRPGLNMLDNDFKPYLMAGVRMSWNIGNFYNSKTNRRLLELRKGSVETNKATFLLNTGIDISRRDSEIETLREQMEYDDEIIALRKSVLEANKAKLAEGTISGTDLVGYMNDELMAEKSKSSNEIRMLLAMYDLKFVTGE